MDHFSYNFDNQQAFDYVVEFMSEQNKRSVRGDGMDCMYRSADGTKCAAGCLLPDEAIKEWTGDSDHKWISEPFAYEGQIIGKVVIEKYLPKVDYELVRQLQGAHDYPSEDFKKSFYEQATKVATNFNLDSSKLESLFIR